MELKKSVNVSNLGTCRNALKYSPTACLSVWSFTKTDLNVSSIDVKNGGSSEFLKMLASSVAGIVCGWHLGEHGKDIQIKDVLLAVPIDHQWLHTLATPFQAQRVSPASMEVA